EFHRVDRAHHIARGAARADEAGGDDGPPAAVTGGIDEAAGHAQRQHQAGARLLIGGADAEGAIEDVDAEQAEIDGDEGAQDRPVYGGQHIGAEHAAQDAGRGQPPEQAPIDVAMADMAGGRGGGGEHFGGMDAGGGGGGRHADGQEHGRADHAIGHAERAIDDLREKAHGCEDEELCSQAVRPPGRVVMSAETKRQRAPRSTQRTISVPAPCSVKSSTRTTWGVLPLRMTTPSTPLSSASRQVSTLGIMPPEMVPSAISALASRTVSSGISLPSLSSTPGTSVRNKRRLAPSEPAMAPAKVSALIL